MFQVEKQAMWTVVLAMVTFLSSVSNWGFLTALLAVATTVCAWSVWNLVKAS